MNRRGWPEKSPLLDQLCIFRTSNPHVVVVTYWHYVHIDMARQGQD